MCGGIGDIACFSFFANKNMSTAEGGMITTNNETLANRVRLLRSHGMTSLTWDRDQGHSFSYDVVELGWNYRMDELRSAIGIVQLKKLAENNRRRSEAAAFYRDRLADIEKISIPFLSAEATSSHHIFPIVLAREVNRQEFMLFMREKGIQTSIHYPLIHKFTEYQKNLPRYVHLPVTEDIETRVITLPLYPSIRQHQLTQVVEAIQAWANTVA